MCGLRGRQQQPGSQVSGEGPTTEQISTPNNAANTTQSMFTCRRVIWMMLSQCAAACAGLTERVKDASRVAPAVPNTPTRERIMRHHVAVYSSRAQQETANFPGSSSLESMAGGAGGAEERRGEVPHLGVGHGVALEDRVLVHRPELLDVLPPAHCNAAHRSSASQGWSPSPTKRQACRAADAQTGGADSQDARGEASCRCNANEHVLICNTAT